MTAHWQYPYSFRCCLPRGSWISALPVGCGHLHPFIVEAHPIDQCLIFFEAEQAWLVISGLRPGRHRTDFNVTKSPRLPIDPTISAFLSNPQPILPGCGTANQPLPVPDRDARRLHRTHDLRHKGYFERKMQHLAHEMVNAFSVKQEKYRGDQNLIHPAKLESFAGRRGEVGDFYLDARTL
jgi:hypothetical protein